MSDRSPVFVDLFAGCGGFSLGLSQAGWQGLFAVEQNQSAFETFSRNFLSDASPISFDWPAWLPKQHHKIRAVLKKHRDQLIALRGRVDLVIGGPLLAYTTQVLRHRFELPSSHSPSSDYHASGSRPIKAQGEAACSLRTRGRDLGDIREPQSAQSIVAPAPVRRMTRRA
jgi:hypothetical protein